MGARRSPYYHAQSINLKTISGVTDQQTRDGHYVHAFNSVLTNTLQNNVQDIIIKGTYYHRCK